MPPIFKPLALTFCLNVSLFATSDCVRVLWSKELFTQEEELGHRPPSIHVWKYFGEDFNRAAFLDLSRNNEGDYYGGLGGWATNQGHFTTDAHTMRHRDSWRGFYSANPVKTEIESGSEGPTLIDRNQFFSLMTMEQTNYIDEDLRKEQVEIINILDPAQVTFFEVTVPASEKRLLEVFGRIPDNAVENPYTRAVRDYFDQFAWGDERDSRHPEKTSANTGYDLKVGAAWVISGQPNHAKLPLHLERGLPRPIDRKEFPFVYEIGRAAQLDKSMFYEAGKAATYFAARDLILHGGKIEDAYFFAHAFTQRIGRIYSFVYQMEQYNSYHEDTEEIALVKNLGDMMELAKVSTFTPMLSKVHREAKGSLSTFESLKLIIDAQQNRTQFLTSETMPDVSIQLRDFSKLSYRLNELSVGQAVSDEKAAEIVRTLQCVKPPILSRDISARWAEHSSYPYVIHVQGKRVRKYSPFSNREEERLEELIDFLQDNQAIEIFAEGKISGDELLVIAYRNALNALVVAGDPSPAETLRNLGVRFVLYGNRSTLTPLSEWFVYRPEQQTFPDLFTGFSQTIRPGINLFAYAYSLEQIEKLQASFNPPEFSRGALHLEKYLTRPELLRPPY